MDEADEVVEAGEAAEVDETQEAERGPLLIVLPDADARVDLADPLLGKPVGQRLVDAALEAGFSAAVIAPGGAYRYERCPEVPVEEAIADGPMVALVAFEGTYIDPALMRLMVEHPLDADERFTLYDGALRPAACFLGEVSTVPAIMPISEEIDWPEELGPDDVARIVYAEDRIRAEWLVLRQKGLLRGFGKPRAELELPDESADVGAVAPSGSTWDREVNLRTLRWLAARRISVAQFEMLALATAVAAGPIALIGRLPALILAGLLLLIGVHVSNLLRALRILRESAGEAGETSPGTWVPGETVAAATRPLSHAILTAVLTYDMVAETDRSGVAGLVLLAMGGVATALSLAHTRSLLRGTESEVLALPRGNTVLRRVGLEVPSWVQGAPLLELMVLVASCTGQPAVPWSVLLLAAVSRLWRWFTAPAKLPPPQAAPDTER